MQIFFSTDINNGLITLDKEESRHCLQSLRKRVGDVITVVDGRGTFYEAEIVEAGKKNCLCRVRRQWEEEQAGPDIHIAIAPTKNINRLEWFLEKAVEIGVDRVSLVLCRHSERRKVRPERLERILLSAMKQSQRASLPQLSELMDVEAFIQSQVSAPGRKFIAYIDENVNAHLWENYEPGENVCILVGPEGGFAPEEVETARQNGFTAVSLGPNRLRTETAGLVACLAVHLRNV